MNLRFLQLQSLKTRVGFWPLAFKKACLASCYRLMQEAS